MRYLSSTNRTIDTFIYEMSFGERLIETFDGASMAEIARQLGVSHSTIRNYVQQGRLPDAEVLIQIVNRTNVSLKWLLTGAGSKSAESDSLGNLGGHLDEGHVASIERLRLDWQEGHGRKISWDDFLELLVTRGELSVKSAAFTEQFKSKFDDLDYVVNRHAIMSQSLVEMIRHEIIHGDLFDPIRDLITSEIAGKDVSQVAQRGGIRDMIRELVQEEIANGRKARLIHMDFGHGEDEEDIPRQKAG